MNIHDLPQDKLWKYAKRELERRFLLEHPPEGINGHPKKLLHDTYLKGTNMRLRKSDDGQRFLYKLTKKLPLEEGKKVSHWISTIYLGKSEYEIFQSLPGKTLVKLRYLIKRENSETIGIDEIRLRDSTLWIAEVEFEDPMRLEAYTFPMYYVDEITNADAFAGDVLAGLM